MTAELALVPPGCCPTCGQQLPTRPAAKRICAACRKPIRRRERYVFDAGQVLHRTCAEIPPTR